MFVSCQQIIINHEHTGWSACGLCNVDSDLIENIGRLTDCVIQFALCHSNYSLYVLSNNQFFVQKEENHILSCVSDQIVSNVCNRFVSSVSYRNATSVS